MDAGESARKQRREHRRGHSFGIRDILDEHGHPGLEIRGGVGGPGLSSALADRVATARNNLRGGFYDLRGALRDRLGGLGDGERPGGLREAWWVRGLPDGLEGGWAPEGGSRLKALGHSSLAALTNYGADMVESVPGTLRLGDWKVAAFLLEQVLQRTGTVEGIRDFAVGQYQSGLQNDETWATIGGGAGFMAAVLIDVAMPGPGGETRVATKLTAEGEKLAVRAADEVAEAGAEALARMADDVTERGARVVDEVSEGVSEGGQRFFRGAKPGQAPDFTPRPNEFKTDPATGTVKPTHGVSVFDNPESVSSKGFVPHEVDQATVPSSLRFNQRGADPAHYEIMPAEGASLTPEQFTTACQGIGCK